MHLLRILVAHYRLNLTGFTSAHNKVHEAVIALAKEIRLKMEQLPTSSNPSSLTSNECPVANACYHVVHQVISILEQLRPTTENAHSFTSGGTQFGNLCSKIHQRVNMRCIQIYYYTLKKLPSICLNI
jgi:hypothetical protein